VTFKSMDDVCTMDDRPARGDSVSDFQRVLALRKKTFWPPCVKPLAAGR
jgi:hypothetical protein